jgi:two-component sensor histidine kinase
MINIQRFADRFLPGETLMPLEPIDRIRFSSYGLILLAGIVMLLVFLTLNIIYQDTTFIVQNTLLILVYLAGMVLLRTGHVESSVNLVFFISLAGAGISILMRIAASEGIVNLVNGFILFMTMLIIPVMVSFIASRLYQVISVNLISLAIILIMFRFLEPITVHVPAIAGFIIIYIFSVAVNFLIYRIILKLRQTAHLADTLTREISHKVKNDSFILNAIIENEKRNNSDDQITRVLDRLNERLQAFYLIHRSLHRSPAPGSVNISLYLEDLLSHLKDIIRDSNNNIDMNWSLDDVSLSSVRAVSLGIIVNELVTNSLKHAFPDRGQGAIKFTLTVRGNEVLFDYRDNGRGLDNYPGNTETFGSVMISTQAKEMGGKFKINGNDGYHFSLSFPA